MGAKAPSQAGLEAYFNAQLEHVQVKLKWIECTTDMRAHLYICVCVCFFYPAMPKQAIGQRKKSFDGMVMRCLHRTTAGGLRPQPRAFGLKKNIHIIFEIQSNVFMAS